MSFSFPRLSHYFFKQILDLLLSPFSFWYSYCAEVVMIDDVPEVFYTSITFKILFYFSCSAWVFSVILSSKLLIQSSALSNLFLILSGVFFILDILFLYFCFYSFYVFFYCLLSLFQFSLRSFFPKVLEYPYNHCFELCIWCLCCLYFI